MLPDYNTDANVEIDWYINNVYQQKRNNMI